MSMIGCFYALKDEDLEEIIKNPKRIRRLWGMPEPVETPSFFSRLFGAKSKPTVPQPPWEPKEKPVPFDVDKAWQGIHFLLTGSDWEGDGPLAFILFGGRDIDEDLGYGAPHGFTSAQVREIDQALQAVDVAALFQKADPAEFASNDIYPDIWTREPKEQCIGYVTDHLKELQKFVSTTAKSGSALIAYIG